VPRRWWVERNDTPLERYETLDERHWYRVARDVRAVWVWHEEDRLATARGIDGEPVVIRSLLWLHGSRVTG
jgi:hypothetical protein